MGAFAGCFGQKRVKPPKISAKAAGSAAIEQYDKDGDGSLSAAELESVPSLASTNFDANGDGNVSPEEITDRIGAWQDTQLGLISFACQVVLDGRPLAGATVKFIPETFLGDNVLPASDTTNKYGIANLSIAKEHLRADLKNHSVIHCGVYKIEITHPEVRIPARYNTETTLGQEAAIETVGMTPTVYELKSG